MKDNDELLMEDLEMIFGGIPNQLDRELNLIASSDKTPEEKKKLINDIKHKILTGKVNTENKGNPRKR